MRAMQLQQVGEPLKLVELPIPNPKSDEFLIKIEACAVCRTDLHIIEGDLKNPKLPLTLGHQIVGTTSEGKRVGVPWLGGTCQKCAFCRSGKENLCDRAIYTGYEKNGGFAEYCVAKKAYCFPIPQKYSAIHAAPLLCAGLIGYRSYRKCTDAKRIGFYGFGAAAHLLIQIANFEKKEIYAFTRPGDKEGQHFAKKLGCVWSGGSDQRSPDLLDAAIIFAPVGELIPTALQSLKKGGIVVCAGIHMSNIPSFPYSLLWQERTVTSVANLTRKDGEEFFKLAENLDIETSVTPYSLEELNQAIEDVRSGAVLGSAVVEISRSL
ncbi:MAG: zinc-dependent alcohol dehydrogenase family protein [Waddliaceae bacterium]